MRIVNADSYNHDLMVVDSQTRLFAGPGRKVDAAEDVEKWAVTTGESWVLSSKSINVQASLLSARI
jgi:hypothetical protein